jgi:ribosome maturation factor RimP
MELKQTVENLLDAALESYPELFLVDLKVGADNSIKVILDGDNSVRLADCVAISRAVEHELDRDTIDFSLEVTSVGVSTPLQLPRQYKKNIGRKIEVTTTAAKTLVGILVKADDTALELSWKTREPKPIGKGKHTVTKTAAVPYATIDKAQILVQF